MTKHSDETFHNSILLLDGNQISILGFSTSIIIFHIFHNTASSLPLPNRQKSTGICCRLFPHWRMLCTLMPQIPHLWQSPCFRNQSQQGDKTWNYSPPTRRLLSFPRGNYSANVALSICLDFIVCWGLVSSFMKAAVVEDILSCSLCERKSEKYAFMVDNLVPVLLRGYITLFGRGLTLQESSNTHAVHILTSIQLLQRYW